MAIEEARRRELYTSLRDKLGEPAADTLMTMLPTEPLPELVTREDMAAFTVMIRSEIRAEGNAVRADLRADFGRLEADFGQLRSEFGELRGESGELRGEFGELRGEFGELRSEFGELRGGFGELRGEFGELRGEFGELRGDISGQLLTFGLTLGGLMFAMLGTILTLGFTGAFA